VHANISKALGCSAYLTNGAVRDLAGIQATGFQVFAGNTAVSHAYAHIVEFGEPVGIGGLRVKPGDLLLGDQHGVLGIPVSIASELPRVAAEILGMERELIDFCRSPDFSFQKLSEKIQGVSNKLGTREKDPK
jgi:4-hydroxy-4-methyl-2-oxoglutarate aldolase